MKTPVLIISLLLFSSFTSISAQEEYLTLRGHVTDRDTREGLPAVTVYVAGQAIYTQTNNDGEYVLKVPAEHRDGSVVYALMGYLRDTVSVAKAQHKADVALVSDGGRWLKEVTVQGGGTAIDRCGEPHTAELPNRQRGRHMVLPRCENDERRTVPLRRDGV